MVRFMGILWSLIGILFYPVAMWVTNPLDSAKYFEKLIRRTIKTHITRAGYNMNTIKRLQVHRIKDVDAQRYDMYDFWTEKKAVMDRWQEQLEGPGSRCLRPVQE
ncbi:hypothetical protein [Microbulbifer harenosus]|uniref:Uncharacterized protein n=3 Tax=Microbulbifer TaxID=48073 RepID=A0ABY2UJJ7_9GAMM|nr:hypothetical protein [Microbulbifer harenosus]TLM78331.1 hypothetical protein FDY93_05900 [Microbulbifer harenosus]